MNNHPTAGLVPVPLNSVKGDSKALFTDYPDLLTVKHLVEITGLSAQTIRREMHRGHIPSMWMGRRLFCPKADFIELVKNEVENGR